MYNSVGSSSDIRLCKKPRKVIYSGFSVFRRMVVSDLKQNGSNQLSDDRINDITSSRWDLMDGDIREQWRIQARNAKLSSSNNGSSVYDEEKLRFLYNDSLRQITENPIHHAQADLNPMQVPKKPTLHALMRKCKTWNSVLVEAEQAELLICSDKRREAFRAQFSNRIAWQFDGDVDALKQCNFCLVAVQPFKFIDENTTHPAEMAGVVFNIMDGIFHSFCHIARPPTCVDDRNDSCNTSSDESIHGLSYEQLNEFGVNCSTISESLIQLSKYRHKVSQEKFFTLNSEMDETINCIDFVLRNSAEKYKPLSVLDVATIDDLASIIFNFLNIKLDRFCKFVDTDKAIQHSTKEKLQTKSSLNFDNVLRDICGNLYKYSQKHVALDNACELHATLKSSNCALSQLYLIVEILRSTIRFERLNMDYLYSFARVAPISLCDLDLARPYEDLDSISEPQMIEVCNVEEIIPASEISKEQRQMPPRLHIFLQAPLEKNVVPAGVSHSVRGNEMNASTRNSSGEPFDLLTHSRNTYSGGVASMDHDVERAVYNTDMGSVTNKNYQLVPEPPTDSIAVSNGSPPDVVRNFDHMRTVSPIHNYEPCLNDPYKQGTASLQQFFPLNQRGFGRGLHLLPEGNLLSFLRLMRSRDSI